MTDVLCSNEERRHLIREHADLNGLDYLEVSEADRRHLTVYFLDKAPAELVPENVRITGGRPGHEVRVTEIDVCRSEDPERDDCLTITVDRPGDFSCYRLCIVELDEKGHSTDRRRADFDPRYACLDFTFKAGCPSDLDCLPVTLCPPTLYEEPEINYLAKDYATFRQLVLDRLALLVPDWRERHVPDIGIALVEILAYVGDHLSYYQDAVATEAYLDTARLRTSVRRHVRLVDYLMHEGCNSRAWISVRTDSDLTLETIGLGFVTALVEALPDAPNVLPVTAISRLSRDAYEWFEPVEPAPIVLRAAHTEILLYTWGDTECCLPVGSVRATLVDGPRDPAGTVVTDDPTQSKGEPDDDPARLLDGLRAGHYLLFEEVLGPGTGNENDADPAHRQVVRLTSVEPGVDPLTGQLVVEVSWAAEDALKFPLCISAIGPPPDCALLDPVSVARANVILVDHGRTVTVDLGAVPTTAVNPPCDEGCPEPTEWVAGRFRPVVVETPLTWSTPLAAGTSAATAVVQDPRSAQPALIVNSKSTTGYESKWTTRSDLFGSGPDDRHVVVEVDDEGRSHLRFGDGVLGRGPDAGDEFTAQVRLGNGPRGNVGAGAIRHLVLPGEMSGQTLSVVNPLPAAGGVTPEPVAEAKTLAPAMFRRQRQRAVTASDYAELAQREMGAAIQRAAAELRWTGSWYEVIVAIDAASRADPDAPLLQRAAGRLERYRRIAHDLRVVAATQVALDVELFVCIAAGHRRGQVLAALLDRFSNRVLADGTRGLFHPDRLSFGEGVFVSRLAAEAASVPGVDNVVVTRLQRLGEPDDFAIDLGVLHLRPNEIARLDNDLSFPEHGLLRLVPGGGR